MYSYHFSGKLPTLENTGALNNVLSQTDEWHIWIEGATLHAQATSQEDWQPVQDEARKRIRIFLDDLAFKYNMRLAFEITTHSRTNLSEPETPVETLKTVSASMCINYEILGPPPTYTALSPHPVAVKARGYYLEGLYKEKELFYLYKAVETLEHFLGGESQLMPKLGVPIQLVKDTKKLANMSRYDERHAPKVGETVRKLTSSEVLQCRQNVKTLIEAFETKFPK
jgi:hypothetical protein